MLVGFGMGHEPIHPFRDKGRIPRGKPMNVVVEPCSFSQKAARRQEADWTFFAMANCFHLPIIAYLYGSRS